MIKSGIYKITALHSGEFYIGSSKNIKNRWNHHKYYLKVNKHHNKILQNIWNKYGSNCFLFEIVEITDDLIIREQYYIDTLNPNLNIRKIAERSYGVKHTKETIEKIRLAKIGLKHTEESKQKMRNAHLGKKLTDEHKNKIRSKVKGVKQRKRTNNEILLNARRQSILTDEQVYQIKWLSWLGLSTNEIAKPFDISNTTVYKIIKGYKKAYNHVTFNPSVPSNS